jgi:hypothetical protein
MISSGEPAQAKARSSNRALHASAGRRYPPLRCDDDRGCKIRAWPVLRAWHPLAAQAHSQGRSLRSRLRRRKQCRVVKGLARLSMMLGLAC